MFARFRLAHRALLLRTSNRGNSQNVPKVKPLDHKSPFPDVSHIPGHNVAPNSILQKFAPPIAYDERFLQRGKDMVTDADREGKTPEEIEKLERDMSIYIHQTELEKLETGRLQDDMSSMRQMLETQRHDWAPYYQKQMTDRLEWVSQNQPRRPIITERSSSMYPYRFYGDITEWSGLDKKLNICRTSHNIKAVRHLHYHSPTGKLYQKRNNQYNRSKMMRAQFTSGEALVNFAPTVAQPYLRLARYDKPVGYQLLFVPAVISLVAGCPYGVFPDPYILSIFAAGTLLTRGAGCTINDIFDHKLDAEVERCKTRPIPSGDVTVQQAQVFFAAQMTAAFGLLCMLNPTTFMLGLAAPIPIILYPLVKRSGIPDRFKHSKMSYLFKPQVALGLTFNWGALMGYSAMTDEINLKIQLPLYLACVCWTIGYDTVYALQDLRDDQKLGLNSMADFSHLLPKQYQNNPAKAFRHHRSRQEILKYQYGAQNQLVNSTLIYTCFCFAFFGHALESEQRLESASTLTFGVFSLTMMNYMWYNMGTSIGKTTEKARWQEFFLRQRYVGLSWICLILAGHGIHHLFKVHDQNGQRIYPIKEQFKEITYSASYNPELR